MEITLTYAIALSGLLLICFLVNLRHSWLPHLSISIPSLFHQFLKYLIYPYAVRRHQLLGPWTYFDILIQILYITGNAFCLSFKVLTLANASVRAGNLSLINMFPLFLGPHLSFLADVLGISLNAVRLMHRTAALMSFMLALLHVGARVILFKTVTLNGMINSSAIVSGSCLATIVVLSWLPLRKYLYEFFLRSHQVLAAAVAISTFLHAHSTTLFPRLYFYVGLGVFTATFAHEAAQVLLRNGVIVLARERRLPRVEEIFKHPSNYAGEDDTNKPLQLTISPQEPLRIEAGQYINIYIPSVSARSLIFFQNHPFVVASWTGKLQSKLELVIEPRRGWTRTLQSRAISATGQNGGLGRVLFTGPHGSIVPIGNYEHIFMIASGYGIVAQLPLLERLVQGTLAREVRARRVRLVWEVEDIGESDSLVVAFPPHISNIELYRAVYPLLNWVLEGDRNLGANSALSISLFSSQSQFPSTSKFSQRAMIGGSLSLKSEFEKEIGEIQQREMKDQEAARKMEVTRAEQIERFRRETILEQQNGDGTHVDVLPVYTSSPKVLITVSASEQIRDELRLLLQSCLRKDITFRELDYQPAEETSR